MAQQPFNPNQVSWSIRHWCADTDLSPAYAYELIAAGTIKSKKIGGKRLIITSPREFIESLDSEPDRAVAEVADSELKQPSDHDGTGLDPSANYKTSSSRLPPGVDTQDRSQSTEPRTRRRLPRELASSHHFLSPRRRQ